MLLYRMIENPQEGQTVQFLAVHALRWQPEWGEPKYAFIEVEPDGPSYQDIGQVALMIGRALTTDGGHHKQWYLEHIAAYLRIDLTELRSKYGEWEEGIAP
jgi:hypothetical protein